MHSSLIYMPINSYLRENGSSAHRSSKSKKKNTSSYDVQRVSSRSLYVVARPSVCLSVVCL